MKDIIIMTRRKTAGRPKQDVAARLFHYTHEHHLESIFRTGELRTTESNISLAREHAGPRVVWLTTNPDLIGTTANGLQLADGRSKAQVRIEVHVPADEVHEWKDWSVRHGSSGADRARLAAAGGFREWRVVERPIPRSEWVDFGFRSDSPLLGQPAASRLDGFGLV
ncbi:hypothetical protein [Microbacterium sp. 1P06AB]|uniref:hypothetical protein n=1 Tax=Microbacterium sp. 1P06AB TaxID=3132289 RepID=UPI0039A464EA